VQQLICNQWKESQKLREEWEQHMLVWAANNRMLLLRPSKSILSALIHAQSSASYLNRRCNSTRATWWRVRTATPRDRTKTRRQSKATRRTPSATNDTAAVGKTVRGTIIMDLRSRALACWHRTTWVLIAHRSNRSTRQRQRNPTELASSIRGITWLFLATTKHSEHLKIMETTWNE